MASKHDDDEEGGELIMAGCAAWSMAGRSGPTRNYDGIPFEGNLLLGFHRVGSFVHSKTLITHVFTGPVASHTICLDTARQVCQFTISWILFFYFFYGNTCSQMIVFLLSLP